MKLLKNILSTRLIALVLLSSSYLSADSAFASSQEDSKTTIEGDNDKIKYTFEVVFIIYTVLIFYFLHHINKRRSNLFCDIYNRNKNFNYNLGSLNFNLYYNGKNTPYPNKHTTINIDREIAKMTTKNMSNNLEKEKFNKKLFFVYQELSLNSYTLKSTTDTEEEIKWTKNSNQYDFIIRALNRIKKIVCEDNDVVDKLYFSILEDQCNFNNINSFLKIEFSSRESEEPSEILVDLIDRVIYKASISKIDKDLLEKVWDGLIFAAGQLNIKIDYKLTHGRSGYYNNNLRVDFLNSLEDDKLNRVLDFLKKRGARTDPDFKEIKRIESTDINLQLFAIWVLPFFFFAYRFFKHLLFAYISLFFSYME